MWWRVFATRDLRPVSLAVNCFGVAIWTAALTAITATRLYPVPAGIAPDLGCALLSLWVLARTNVNAAPGWRGD